MYILGVAAATPSEKLKKGSLVVSEAPRRPRARSDGKSSSLNNDAAKEKKHAHFIIHSSWKKSLKISISEHVRAATFREGVNRLTRVLFVPRTVRR